MITRREFYHCAKQPVSDFDGQILYIRQLPSNLHRLSDNSPASPVGPLLDVPLHFYYHVINILNPAPLIKTNIYMLGSVCCKSDRKQTAPTLWEPSAYDRICSKHFLTGKYYYFIIIIVKGAG